MRAKIDERLAQLGIVLPTAASPAGSYLPFVFVGSQLIVSGQLPIEDGSVACCGRIGTEVSVEAGSAAARLCGLNLLAQARAACDGDLDRVRRVIRLGGFVQAGPGFSDHPKVINGASELMVEVFGPAGRHARFAVGASSLPLNAAVEIEAMFEVA
ncbi:MAG: RidA family protein [Rhodospirillales bacterium]|nr:RidA family protein [Rhodospirillales bacterium]